MKAAIYCRVSTLDQSADMQRSDLRRYCEQRGVDMYHEYIDQGVSGTKDRRPALDALMDDARKRRFDGVLCWRFDRFARSTQHLISALDEFKHLGIDFISYQENIDTSSPLGKAMFTIVAAIAELERNIIVERIRGGLRRAREQGKRLGTICDMKAQGMSVRAIADAVELSKSFAPKTCQNCPPKTLEISI